MNTSGKLTFSGNLKYHTTSPKCTYNTPTFEGPFEIAGRVKAALTAKGELVSSESEEGCASTATVEGSGELKDLHFEGHPVFWAERKSEK